MSEKKSNRRDFLFTATYAVGAVGVGATVWPMIDQMNPDASVKALASTEVDVSSLSRGKTITVQIGRAHVRTPVTRGSRMPSSA